MRKAFFSSDLSLKLFSLALGIVIFFAVRTEQEVTTTIALRLALREPAHLINTADVPPEITVRLSGSSNAIRALAPEQIRPVTLDLSTFSRGSSTVRIREEQLALPPDLDVVSISPSSIGVKLEAKEKKRVQVKPVLRGKTARGFVVERTEVDPGAIEVEGPHREMRDLRFVETAPVDIDGATEPVSASVVFELPGAHSRVASGTHRAEVRVAIGVERLERLVQVVVAGLPGEKRTPVKARLRGPRTVMEGLDEKSLAAFAVTDGDNNGRTPFSVRIENLPEGVEILEPLPTVPRPPPPPKRP